MYIPFKPDKPAGADTPPIYSADDLANIRALRDGVVSGFMQGWAYQLDAASPPTWFKWTSGLLGFRVTMGYSAGVPSFLNSALWEFTEDGGAIWTPINTGGTAVAITTDANGSILSVDKDAGLWVMACSAFNRIRYAEDSIDDHEALTGTAVHGLGTMATQNAGGVAITGGSVSNVKAELLDRLTPDWPPDLNASGAWDWAATPTMGQTPAGWACTSIDNAQPGEMKRVHVYSAGAITLPAACIFATGHPVWGTTGTMVNLIALNDGGILVTTIPF